jgi:hypothetical protein
MKLKVTGIETIELTDPRGHCGVQNPLQTVGGLGDVDIPAPTISSPTLPKGHPGWAKIYTNHLSDRVMGDKEKWGMGLTGQTEPQKWEPNWQAGIGIAAQDVKAGDAVELI